ncbi:hypothetical protein AY601_4115 [Pedobacter cryoconitis]|uniref:Uncharacterized protein n=1 Tax=Pedobacter cryoconitis TaxID=188932 RepID=A0A127VI18_9SPHI|nr:hypothetical protein AY601_4115 [Pedobacter cryoconitis]
MDLTVESLFKKKYRSLMTEKHIDRWTRVTLTVEIDIARIKPTFLIHQKGFQILATDNLDIAVQKFNSLKPS